MLKPEQTKQLLTNSNCLKILFKPFAFIGFSIFIVFFFLSALTIFSNPKAYALASNTINFQARLEQSNGAIVPDGSYNVAFTLYSGCTSEPTANTGCTQLWSETYQNSNSQGIAVHNGFLTTSLGSITPFPSTINWNQQLWLGMNIGGTSTSSTPTYDGVMSPYLLLTAVPYAFQANQLAQYNSSNGYNSTLSLVQPTVGNQTFQIDDQAAAGTYTLCIQGATTANGGCAPSTGGAGYIQNQNVAVQSGSFNIAATSGVAASIEGASGQNIANFLNSSGTNVASISSNGTISSDGGLNLCLGALCSAASVVSGSNNSALFINNGAYSYGLSVNANAHEGILVNGSSANVPNLVLANSTGGGSLLQLQDSNGDVLSQFDSNGNLTSNGTNITLSSLAIPAAPTVSSTGTAYYYAVAAYNGQGTTLPSIGTGASTDSALTVSWTQVVGATGYYVYRSTTNNFSAGTSVTLVGTITNGTTVSFVDSADAGTSTTISNPSGTGLTLQGWNGQTSSVLNIKNGSGSSVASINANGQALFSNSTNSTTALQVQNSSSNNVLAIDTTNNQVLLGQASTINGQLAFYNSTNAYTVTILSGATTASYSLTLPTAAPGTSECLSSGSTTASLLQWTSCGSSSGSGVTTVGTLDGGTANANGAYISGSDIYLQSASTSYPGLVNNTTQSFSGNKTFSSSTTLAGSLLAQGSSIFESLTNSTTALQIQNSSGDSVLTADTTNNQVLLGASSLINGQLAFYNASNANAVTLTSGVTSASYGLTLPTAAPSTNECLKSGTTTAGVLQWGSCSSPHPQEIILTPEYAGAVFSTGGLTNDIGTMTAGYDSTQNESYYQWTTGQSTNQAYEIIVRIPIPSNFSSWASSTPITINDMTSDTTNGTISGIILDTSGTVETAWNSCSLTPTTTNTWTTITGCSISGTYTPNGIMTLKITLQAPPNGITELGDITLSYNTSF